MSYKMDREQEKRNLVTDILQGLKDLKLKKTYSVLNMTLSGGIHRENYITVLEKLEKLGYSTPIDYEENLKFKIIKKIDLTTEDLFKGGLQIVTGDALLI